MPTKTVSETSAPPSLYPRSIEQAMLEAYRHYGNETDAAHSLGITQETFNKLKFHLGLEKQIAEITNHWTDPR